MIDTLLSEVKAALDTIKDHSMADGNLRYSLGDVLMSAFTIRGLRLSRFAGSLKGLSPGAIIAEDWSRIMSEPYKVRQFG